MAILADLWGLILYLFSVDILYNAVSVEMQSELRRKPVGCVGVGGGSGRRRGGEGWSELRIPIMDSI